CFTTLLLLLIRLSLREDDLKYKEKDDHRYAACDKCYKQVVNCRSYILLRNRHPQVIESVTDQRDRHPCDKVPHSLVDRIPLTLKCNISLEREVDALRKERTDFITDKIAKASSDQHFTCRFICKHFVP